MPVVADLRSPSLTQERYEESVGNHRRQEPRQSPSDWPVEGLLAHVSGHGPNFRVVDVWESEDAFGRFGNSLMPVLAELGVEEGGRVYAHTFVSARTRTVAGCRSRFAILRRDGARPSCPPPAPRRT